MSYYKDDASKKEGGCSYDALDALALAREAAKQARDLREVEIEMATDNTRVKVRAKA